MRRIVLILFALTCISVNAEEYFEVDSILYNILSPKDLTVYVRNIYKGGDIFIPSTIEYNNRTFKVVKIGYGALRNLSPVKSIIISENITEIDENAFSAREHVQEMTLPSSLNRIGIRSFNRIRIERINMPSIGAICNMHQSSDSDTYFKTKVYVEGKEVTNIVVPETVEELYRNVFAYLENLRSLTITKNVKFLGQMACWDCKNLSEVTIESDTLKIEDNIFRGCDNLKKITIKSQNMPIIERGTLDDSVKTFTDLYVPANMVEKYKQDKYWGEMAVIKPIEE